MLTILIQILQNKNQFMSYSQLHQDPVHIHFSTLIIMNRLGRGSSSHVFKTQSIRSKLYYAMKVLDKSSPTYNPETLQKQIKIHKLLKNAHISTFIKHFEDQSNHYLLTQYCNRGEITKLLMKPVKEKRLWKIIGHIGSALNYMHTEVGVVHGDVKLSNILISGSTYKLCDFGFSNFISHSQSGSAEGPFGTLMYMSPQILANKSNKAYKQSDIWALGICILTLMYQGNPYLTDSPYLLKKKITNGEHIKPNKGNFPHYSLQLLTLLSKMLSINHEQRISAKDITNIAYSQFCFEGVKTEVDGQKETQYFILQSEPEYTDKECLLKAETENENDDLYSNYTEHEKQDQNKSIFNSTTDTLFDQQSQVGLEQLKMWSYCLKPQKHETEKQGYIQILPNRSIKIKVESLEYIIQPNFCSLEIIKGKKISKKYSIDQINKTEKIKTLYNYAAELVGVLKKKQFLREQIINGKYYWLNKSSIGCLMNDGLLIEKQIGGIEVQAQVLRQQKMGRYKCTDGNKYKQYIQKGEDFFLNNYYTK